MEASLSFIVPLRKSLSTNHLNYMRCLISLVEQRTDFPTDIIFVVDGVAEEEKPTIEKELGLGLEEAQRIVDAVVPESMKGQCCHRCGLLTIKEWKGSGGSRNAGIKDSDSEWIWCIDADDWITDPYAAMTLVHAAEEHPELHALQCDSYQGLVPNKQAPMMPWLRIVKRETYLAAPFPEKTLSNEDTAQFVALRDILTNTDHGLHVIQHQAPYFYNVMAPSSATAHHGGLFETKVEPEYSDGPQW